VAERVVDGLEIVQVDQQQRVGLTGAGGQGEPLEEEAAVRQAVLEVVDDRRARADSAVAGGSCDAARITAADAGYGQALVGA
jgi:hypothetical protein